MRQIDTPIRQPAEGAGLGPGVSGPSSREPRPSRGPQPVTGRALLLGLILLPPACWWLQYTECVAEGTDMSGISYVLPAVFLLFVLTAANRWARARWPRRALSQGELLVVFAMLSAGLTIGGPGGMQHLVTALGNVQWYAGARRWEWMLPLLPPWLFPDREALGGFYRGGAPRVPWEAWFGPAAIWGAFIFVLVFVMLCAASLLRRQWTEHERLTYPLVYLPLEMTREDGPLLGARSRGFWSAVLLALLLQSQRSLNYLYPSLPSIPVKQIDLGFDAYPHPWNAIGYFAVGYYPMVLGIGYLIPLEILFSYVFFYMLTKVERVGCAALGWSEGAGRQLPYLDAQGAGAWLAVALGALWMARRHLWRAVRGRVPAQPVGTHAGEEPAEAIPHRLALLGIAGGVLLLVGFGHAVGMSPAVAFGMIALYLLYVLAAARVRAEAGTAWLFSPGINAPALLVAWQGPAQLGPANLVGMSCLQWFMINTECVAMPYHLEGFRLADGARLQRSGMFRALLLASAVGIAAAFWTILSLYYHYGAATAKVEPWRAGMGSVPWERLAAWIEAPERPDVPTLQAAGFGMLVVAILSALRLQFLWWPLHPIGYAVANTWTMAWLWFPCMVIWVLKALVLRYGGLRLYRHWMPFFLGLILGDYLAGGLWAILGAALDIKIYRVFV